MKMIKMNKIKSMAMAFSMFFVFSTVLGACGQKQSGAGTTATTAPSSTAAVTEQVSGSATAVGSTALQPLAEGASKLFMDKNKNAKVQVQGGGSGTGLTQVQSGGADIGNSDIYAEEKLTADQAKELVDHQVCVVGFATVVNPKIKVDNLTKQQLVDIFTGKITNWKDVGGDDKKIVIVNRPASSGTRATFKKYGLGGADEAAGLALTEDASGTVRKAVADTDGAISYLALSYVDNTVKALKLDGVDATADNIKSGKYPIWAYEHMYTKGEAKGVAKAFLDYITTDKDVQKLVVELGYIPTSEMKVKR